VEILVCLMVAFVAYLLGSIPAGYLAGVMKGIDIRAVGSGNIGATNVFRILGKTAGIIVLVVDGLKGWIAVALIPQFIYSRFFSTPWNDHAPESEYLQLIAGLSVILGHNYTCWLKFKGGKGIATSAGVLAALVPVTFLAGLLTWIIVCLATRYVSLASMAAAVALPFATWASRLVGHPYSYRMIIVVTLMSTLAIYKHKANIARLMNGTENRLGRKKAPPPTGTAP
jgi:glycerol-3-phosphate acyltransferase PlsY